MSVNQFFTDTEKKQELLSLLCYELEKEIESLKRDVGKLRVDILEIGKKHKISNILKHIIDLPQN